MPSKYNLRPRRNKKKLSSKTMKITSKTNSETLQWIDYWLTISLGVILILIYLFGDILFPGNFFIQTPDEIIGLFGQSNARIWNQGEWYRLFSAIFIHASIFHLGGNLLFLAIFGFRLEELHGSFVVLIVFIVSGLTGNLLTLSLIFLGSSDFWSVGASGGIQGLLAANLFFLRKQFARGPMTALSFIGFFFIFSIGVNTNVFAHVGGIVGGIIIALIIENYWIEDNEFQLNY
ncbi:MAG: rhomboid family intramembrane serine protease [Candidatus Hodarchaeales archaeon]|jgi:rhomboid protease GluP